MIASFVCVCGGGGGSGEPKYEVTRGKITSTNDLISIPKRQKQKKTNFEDSMWESLFT